MEDLTILTDASILSYIKMLSYAKDLIPDICGQNFNNSGLQKSVCIQTAFMSLFLANTNILFYHNIYTKAKMNNIGRNVRSATLWKL